MTEEIIDGLTDVERNVYLALVYLNDKASLNGSYNGRKLFSREEIKQAYKEFSGEEISSKILDETIDDLNHTEIDFTDSKFEGEVGERRLANYIDGKGKINVGLSFGDICSIMNFLRVNPYVKFNRDGSFVEGYYEVFIFSRRAIEAVYENSKDVKFKRMVKDKG